MDPPERDNHVNLYHRLVPQGGGGQEETRGMDEDDLSKISGPEKNVVSNITQIFIQHMDPQNYEEERIK